MRCEEARPLLSAWIDGEFGPEDSAAIAGHVGGCTSCAAEADQLRRLGEALRRAAYEKAPTDLAARISAMLDAEEEPATTAPRAGALQDARVAARRTIGGWLQRAAVLLLACGLSAAGAWHLARVQQQRAGIEHDVVSAHLRSLIQENPVQVASSERHTVKPWFAGKAEVSPVVKDLTAEGFPLVGGRLDYVGGQRVAVVVYKRRSHVINVFSWPRGAAGSGALPDVPALAATSFAAKGYNGLHWTAGEIENWAVSDLNAAELAQLQKLLLP